MRRPPKIAFANNCRRLLREADGITYWKCPAEYPEVFRIAAFDGEIPVGAAAAEKVDRPRGMKVGIVKVDDDYRKGAPKGGKKVGTRLWEAVASQACAEGRPLVSDDLRSRYAEAFWRKQEVKGRAQCLPGKGDVYKPGEVVPGAPEPIVVKGKRVWPCKRFVTSCPAPSFEGVRRRER
ncbi:MAG: GNAT family N-acetyltransferase [Acidobacteria bacterium]|nr:GNAT family N-acetyltransferase [Acidobacteriota bacterium]